MRLGHDDVFEMFLAPLFFAGTLYERFIFRVNFGFANTGDGSVEMKDLYLGLTKLGPAGTVRVGHMKEDFSLEEMTSSKYLVFMERALPSVFNPGRSTGLSAYNTFLEGRLRYALGGFTTLSGTRKLEAARNREGQSDSRATQSW